MPGLGERQSHIPLATRAQARIWFSRERLLVAILVKHGAIMSMARYYNDAENKRETGSGIIDFAGEGSVTVQLNHLNLFGPARRSFALPPGGHRERYKAVGVTTIGRLGCPARHKRSRMRSQLTI